MRHLLMLLCLFAALTGYTRNERQGIATPVAAVRPLVVEIETFQNLAPTGFGSGVVVDRHGYVVTCWHVLEGSDSWHIGKASAVLIAKDEALDLALVKVDFDFGRSVTWGNSATLRPGDAVFAVGYPFNIGELVSSGVISSMSVKLGETPVLVTDAPINPGCSGGGLFDSRGAFIGMPHRFYAPGGVPGNIGIGLAIPSNTAHLFVNRNLP